MNVKDLTHNHNISTGITDLLREKNEFDTDCIFIYNCYQQRNKDMYCQILVNVCKEYVIYIVYYIAEFCQKLTRGLKEKGNKNILYIILLYIFSILVEPSYILI